VRLGIDLLWSSPAKEAVYGRMSVDEWLREMGQSETARRHLWDVIAIGSLNEAPERISALLFFRVLRAAFFGRRTNASMLIPTVGLSELLVEPARAFVEGRGGVVMTGTAVSEVVVHQGRVTGVKVGAQEIAASQVVVAVPHHAVSSLLPVPLSPLPASQLSTSPIITVNLWFDKTVMDEEFVALLNGRMHWAFNRSRMLALKTEGQYIACVVSGAAALAELEKDELVRMAVEDLRAAFPAMREARVRHSLVVKEMHATFVPVPGTESLRPDTKTSVEGLYLAGDWTNTGLPATIEGAILSGRRAAEAILGKSN
jgi:zeta-carotene desaturase